MKYQGSPVSRGIAFARIFCFHDEKLAVEHRTLEEPLRDAELQRYHSAVQAAEQQLQEIYEKCRAHDAEKAKIFQAHIDILQDLQVREEIDAAILAEGKCAQWAVADVYDLYAGVLAASEDALIRERSVDLQDVSVRIQRILLGAEPAVSLGDLPDGVLLVAHDLLPSQTVSLDSRRVRGIVTEVGGMTSHTAILARSFGIPAVLGIPEILRELKNDTPAILDGVDGVLLTNPTTEQTELYQKKQAAFVKEQNYERTFLPQEPITKDGLRVGVHLNIGDADDSRYRDMLPYVDGAGLFRSEFLYLARATLPTEEEQYEIYSHTLKNFDGRPVILRTLDIGGDKKTDCITIPAEDNPFLGLRALRLCFAMPGLLRTQLRAAYRAAVHGNLWIMFPMVNSLDDVRKAKAFCRDVCRELDREGIPYGKKVKLGIMIETPSMALMAKEAAREVDFASIGTNDLCQYTLAVDRMNPTVRPYYMPYHPALLRLIASVTQAFCEAGKPISVCGELGGDPKIIPFLIGCGIHKLSMSPSAVAAAKAAICNLDYWRAKRLAERALSMATEDEVRQIL